jgi:hypothetical protein
MPQPRHKRKNFKSISVVNRPNLPDLPATLSQYLYLRILDLKIGIYSEYIKACTSQTM